jgi:RNA polymerase sigma-70 factor (ECF subfamily)
VDRLTGSARPTPHELVERRDEWSFVQQAVSSLPLAQRVVVVLYYLNDLSLQEIADILDVPIGTVKSRLHYGRLALKKKLGMLDDGLLDLNFERS